MNKKGIKANAKAKQKIESSSDEHGEGDDEDDEEIVPLSPPKKKAKYPVKKRPKLSSHDPPKEVIIAMDVVRPQLKSGATVKVTPPNPSVILNSNNKLKKQPSSVRERLVKKLKMKPTWGRN
jgi:hypothetical protein